MKFIWSVLVILIVVLILFLVPLKKATSYVSYDESTEKASFRFTKGWNLYPALAGDSTGNNCQGKDEKGTPHTLAYLFSPLSKSYLMVGGETMKELEDEQKKYGKEGKQPLYPFGAWWYYSKSECDAWITYEAGGLNPFLDIFEGWQFVVKLPWMAKQEASVLFSECEIVKFNLWDNENKKWKHSPTKTDKEDLINDFDSADIGMTFVVKFASDCSLKYSLQKAIESSVGIEGGPPALE